MKFVKKTVSLPPDLYKFAEKRAAEIASERGENPNISAVVRELLLKAKNKSDELKHAA